MKTFAAIVTLSGVVLAAGAARAQQATATAPATQPADVEPKALKVLTDLEAAGKLYATIRAELDYKVEMGSLGDSEQRTGSVAYQRADAKDPAKFRIAFDTLRQGEGPKIRDQVEYVFDGQWLAALKYRIKSVTLYQLAAEGQRIEPLRIGKGPFPLPFGQRTDEVIKHFEVKLMPNGTSDPKNTDRLRLTTRPAYVKDMSFRYLDLWVDRTTHLPVKIRSLDPSRNITTALFGKVQTNTKPEPDLFRIPVKAGWQRTVRPL